MDNSGKTTYKSIVVRRYIYIVVWTIIIIVFSLLPKNTLEPEGIKLFKGADKVLHFLMYALLMFFWVYAAMEIPRERRNRFLYSGLAFGIILGIVMEILQKYMNLGRSFDAFDIMANIAGTLFIFLINKNT